MLCKFYQNIYSALVFLSAFGSPFTHGSVKLGSTVKDALKIPETLTILVAYTCIKNDGNRYELPYLFPALPHHKRKNFSRIIKSAT